MFVSFFLNEQKVNKYLRRKKKKEKEKTRLKKKTARKELPRFPKVALVDVGHISFRQYASRIQKLQRQFKERSRVYLISYLHFKAI